MNLADANALQKPDINQNKTGERLYIDAGVGHLRLRVCAADGTQIENVVLPSNRDLRGVFEEQRVTERFGGGEDCAVFITGKLAPMVRQALGGGKVFLHAAAQWLAARERVAATHAASLAMIEISASGYGLVGVDKEGQLKDDLLVANPRCGAGSGVNLDRVLQKLGLNRSQVDEVLADYLGEIGRERREKITTRADRCGVFGSSATISDKNQGIPLAVALATTIKSEVLKVCRKLPEGFEHAIMLGRFFNWQFVRDCAEDHLRALGVKTIEYDPDNTLVLDALHRMIERVGPDALAQPDTRLLSEPSLKEYPPFTERKASFEAAHLYTRMPSPGMKVAPPANMAALPVHIGLDVGSTMAKVAMTDDSGELVFLDAYSNAGDTIATVKRVLTDLRERGIESLNVRSIGITGSARYQVREALSRIYPQLDSRIAVLVENYAHARGSIDQARQHLVDLKAAGITDLNEDFCILVDIGGEDTKISTLALKEAELFNNAMNIKCSAGTGSLMDTLSTLFGIPGAGEASKAAMAAPRSFEINATCAVFLMENAQKLQAQGIPRDEILASANWAIVENMARTLWSQVELPPRTVVLLHGQTMLSDPLPLAVTHRLQEYLGEPSYSLVPPYPGHRACIGLIRTMLRTAPEGAEAMPFADFIDAEFEKRIIQCKGAACEDPEAVCNRTSLKCRGSDGKSFTFTLGGCSAINELFAKAKDNKAGKTAATAQARDTYKEIWDFIDSRHPRSDDPYRLVIPRSFVVSEWAHFLSQIFVTLGLPVHVDNVRDQDLSRAQPHFDVDSCAPHMGAVGQFTRLAGEPHGIILAPQIEILPTNGKSMGRTCTLNQGGVAVAKGLAENAHPNARFHLFNVNLSALEAGAICDQLFDRLQAVFRFYNITPDRAGFTAAIQSALDARQTLRAETADLAAGMIEEAHAAGQRIALVVGREYLLNPGIYDSHVRRLLRDKQMLAIPSYVLDVELDEDFGHIYWRNPHLIASILHAVAEKRLHERVKQPRLAAILGQIESGEDLLPVVQISTFCCGPDSVTQPLMSELMKKRPFLLIQSDAIIKELAHLENRVNTYVRQLELGLHGKLRMGDDSAFEIRTLDQLENERPMNRDTDVIYFPTLADNRVLTSTLRGAGFTCVDNYTDGFDLQDLIKSGRKAVGDAVCAPMAAVYGDLQRATADFSRRKAGNDPLLAGKSRLLFFNNAGTGPCRQGQYVEVHKLMVHRERNRSRDAAADECHNGLESVMRFLVARESAGYNFGLEEWSLLRLYQGAILQGVLQEILFTGGANCRDYAEYETFLAEYRKMKEEVYAALEAFHGPGALGRAAVDLLGTPAKYFAYRLHGRDLTEPLKRFAARWIDGRAPAQKPLSVHITGEVYMRVAQAEDIFRTLLATLGFGRFHLETAPVWGYLEYLVEEAAEDAREAIATAEAKLARQGNDSETAKTLQEARAKLKRIGHLRWMLRNLLAKPLYDAAGLSLPKAAAKTMEAAKEVLPTLRPIGELGPYAGEIIMGLREGHDVFLNVAPTGCMVSTMGQVFAPRLRAAAEGEGRIQHLFSADGEVNAETLALAMLKRLGPEGFFVRTPAPAQA
ncbi:BadF/BadG/BcrA/BcrD ATPase family protein [Formivibrio citricus]|uniref:BadF/BadG/BcrA/BcrD ATPase family protein n=1 Tax=Formivibrio citricus TaxID=83765 RepID=A0A1I4WAX8_9NEIS|nr:BadF/BadG/BcrA/BcrD ATPase family protein [Formivibrio citricus]SFN10482.1 BadF/BadG/BcrA/BcrD ATPase family protein [Formivibrio citricus]